MTVHQVPMDEFGQELDIDAKFHSTPTYKRPRPMSHWTKARVLEMCEAADMPVASMDVIERMSLEDIQKSCLVYVGTFITGSRHDISRTRHTRFYRLDYDFIRELGGVL